jgi:trans-aconitate 2-methyltransferase
LPTWDVVQYLKFDDQRTRPARELLGRVPLAAAARVVDLGCGPGNSTALLCARWPSAQVIGVDNSPQMLRAARKALPALEFIEQDAAAFRAEAALDVLFANAVLHWVPDHASLFPALLEQLREGGALAIQMPANHDEPSHRLMRELPGWRERLSHVRSQSPVASAEFYYDLLAERARTLDIWHTRYEQVMDGPAAIVEWVRGTGLLPYLEALGDDEREDYVRDYSAAIAQAYPARRDGKRLFPFPRLFLVAVR